MSRTTKQTPNYVDTLAGGTAFAVFSATGVLKTVSERFAALYGYESTHLVGSHVALLSVREAHAADEQRAIWEAVAAGERREGYCQHAKRDGQSVWVHAQWIPALANDGSVDHVVLTVREAQDEKEKSSHDARVHASIDRSMATIFFAPDGTITEANEHFLRVMGYEREEVVGRHHRMFVDASYAATPEYEEHWRRLRSGESVSSEFCRIRKDGDRVWIRASYAPLLDDGGKVVAVMKVASDVTEARLDAAADKGEVDAIRRALAVIEFDLDGTIRSANENFLSAMGYTEQEVVGQHHSMFVDADYAASSEYREHWARLAAGDFLAGEYRRQGKGEREVWIQASYNPVHGIDGAPVRVVKFATDVTAAKRAAMENARMRQAVDGSQVLMMLADAEFDVIYANRAVVDMFERYADAFRRHIPGFDPKEIIGSSIDAFHQDPRQQRRLLQGLTGAHQSRVVVDDCTFDLAVTPVDYQGKRVGYSLEWIDMTSQVRAERRIAKLLEAAMAGDLDQRIDVDGIDGGMAELATALNKFVDLVTAPIRQLGALSDALAAGDLRGTLDGDYAGQFAELQTSVNGFIERFNSILWRASVVAGDVEAAAKEVASCSIELRGNVEGQSAAVEESTAALAQTGAQVTANAENSEVANKLVQSMAESASVGQERMNDMRTAMSEIADSSQEIANIIQVIEEIAFQTNLLALNAAVEAARAGEYGKGFAVVAQEVRTLAQRSTKAAKETAGIIARSRKTVEGGVQISSATSGALEDIVQNVMKVRDLVAEIAAASKEQSEGVRGVQEAMVSLSESARSGASYSEELSAAGRQLNARTIDLNAAVSEFQLAERPQEDDEVTPALIEKVLEAIAKRGGDLGRFAHRPAKNDTEPEPSRKAAVGAEPDPATIMPLDADERGFGSF